jgi:hypothetical protein
MLLDSAGYLKLSVTLHACCYPVKYKTMDDPCISQRGLHVYMMLIIRRIREQDFGLSYKLKSANDTCLQGSGTDGYMAP